MHYLCKDININMNGCFSMKSEKEKMLSSEIHNANNIPANVLAVGNLCQIIRHLIN